MAKLEKYFCGEEKWLNFSANFGDDWENSDFQKKLLKQLNNKLDLAKVINYHIGKSSLDWVNKQIPILDGLSPKECLNDLQTEKRLKECLMRMH